MMTAEDFTALCAELGITTGRSTLTEYSSDELRKLWVAMLRSGKYTQGQNFLRTDFVRPQHCADVVDVETNDLLPHVRDLPVGSPELKSKYCCLGVGGDMFVKLGFATWDHAQMDEAWSLITSDCVHTLVLSRSLTAALNIAHADESERERIGQYALTEANDHYRFTFNQIAAAIEANSPAMLVHLKEEN